MSKTSKLFAALTLLALFPAAGAHAQTQEARLDAVFYSRSFAPGVESFDAGRYEEALEACLNAVAANPRDASALYYLGLSYYSMNRYQRALAAYRRARSLDPKMEEARRDLAWLKTYVSGGEDGGKPRVEVEGRAAEGGARVSTADGGAGKGSVGVVRPK